MKWNRETLRAEAKRYKTLSDFAKYSLGAYSTMNKKFKKDKKYICSHFKRPTVHNKKWTFESIKIEALKYETSIEFSRNSNSAFNTVYSFSKSEQKEIKKHFKKISKRKWNIKNIKEEALKYKHRVDFKNGSNLAYETMIYHYQNEKEDICSHMIKKSSGYDYNSPAILYYLSLENGRAYKIGITNRTVEQRYSSEELSKIKVLMTVQYQCGIDAQKAEQQILKDFKFAKWDGEKILKDGNTEIFKYDVLDMDKGL